MNKFSHLLKFKSTIALFIYLFLIAYFQLHFSEVISHKYETISICLNVFSIIILLHFIGKSNRIVTVILSIVFSILITLEAYYGFFFRSIISVGVVSSVMEANRAEAIFVVKEFAVKYLILFCLSFLLIFQSVKELKKLRVSVKWGAIFLAGYLFVAFPLYFRHRVKKEELLSTLYKDTPALAYQIALSQKCPLIYGQLSSIVAYYGERYQLKRYPQQVRSLPEGIFVNDQTCLPEKIFFVLGESACRKHLSVYGYDVRTTPFLDSLMQSSSEVLIYDGVSPANLTRNAVRLLLTFATPMDMQPYYSQKNIIELANDAGYQTFWLSNQSNYGWHSNFATLLSTLTYDTYFTGHEPESETIQIDDLTLIPILRERYRKDTKQFFLIHLMGSHFDYTNRSDETDKKHIKGDDKISRFDRSIHHTDRVLKEIYHIMNQNDTSSVFYYVSDHGQSFEHLGHGFLDSNVSQFEVPMVVIHQTGIHVDSIVNKYYQHDHAWINTLCSINIIAEIMGYSFTDEFIEHVREQGKYIYHVDSQVYKFEDLEQAKNENDR